MLAYLGDPRYQGLALGSVLISTILTKLHERREGIRYHSQGQKHGAIRALLYNEILRLEIIYRGPNTSFTSLRTLGDRDTILNLEAGTCVRRRTLC
jgi:hypothetical protein